MCFPEYRLEISNQAASDLDNIRLYTIEHWGKAQLEVYNTLLKQRLDDIRANPSVGYNRSDILPNHRFLNAGKHIIIYQVAGDVIYITRILHQKMNISFGL